MYAPDKVGQDRAAPGVRPDGRVVLQRLLQVRERHKEGACVVSCGTRATHTHPSTQSASGARRWPASYVGKKEAFALRLFARVWDLHRLHFAPQRGLLAGPAGNKDVGDRRRRRHTAVSAARARGTYKNGLSLRVGCPPLGVPRARASAYCTAASASLRVAKKASCSSLSRSRRIRASGAANPNAPTIRFAGNGHGCELPVSVVRGGAHAPVVGDLRDAHARLLERLAAHGLLERLGRLHEPAAGQLPPHSVATHAMHE